MNDRVDAVRVLGSHSGAQVGVDRDGFHAGLPTDRRATLLELTDAGRSEIESTLGPRLLEIDALFDVLSTTEKARLLSGLKLLVDAMDEVAAEQI